MAAVKWKLVNLCAFVDVNGLQIDGKARDVMPTEPLGKKFEAFNWNALSIDDHNFEQILSAPEKVKECASPPCRFSPSGEFLYPFPAFSCNIAGYTLK